MWGNAGEKNLANSSIFFYLEIKSRVPIDTYRTQEYSTVCKVGQLVLIKCTCTPRAYLDFSGGQVAPHLATSFRVT